MKYILFLILIEKTVLRARRRATEMVVLDKILPNQNMPVVLENF